MKPLLRIFIFIIAVLIYTPAYSQTISQEGQYQGFQRVNGGMFVDSSFRLPWRKLSKWKYSNSSVTNIGLIQINPLDSLPYYGRGDNTFWRILTINDTNLFKAITDSFIYSTRAWRQKGDDSVMAVSLVVLADTASAIRSSIPVVSGFATHVDVGDTANTIRSYLLTAIGDSASSVRSGTQTNLNDTATAIRSAIPNVSNFATHVDVGDTATNVRSYLLTAIADTASVVRTAAQTNLNDTAAAIRSAIPNVSNFATHVDVGDTASNVRSYLLTALADTSVVVRSAAQTNLIDTAILRVRYIDSNTVYVPKYGVDTAKSAIRNTAQTNLVDTAGAIRSSMPSGLYSIPAKTVVANTTTANAVPASSVGYDSVSSANTLVRRDVNQNAFANNFNSKWTNVVSAAGTTTLTAASTRGNNLTGSQKQTFQLPDATTLTVGSKWEFNNNSSDTLFVNNAAGTRIGFTAAGGKSEAIAIAVPTSAGSWDYHHWLTSNAVSGSAGTVLPGKLNVVGNATANNLSGTNTGDQTIVISGAISGTGQTTIVTTLNASVVGTLNISATGTPSGTTYLSGANAWSVPSGVPGGTNTQFQYNNNGAFAGSSGLGYASDGNTLVTTGIYTTAVTAPSAGNVKAYGSSINGEDELWTSNSSGVDLALQTDMGMHQYGQFSTNGTAIQTTGHFVSAISNAGTSTFNLRTYDATNLAPNLMYNKLTGTASTNNQVELWYGFTGRDAMVGNAAFGAGSKLTIDCVLPAYVSTQRFFAGYTATFGQISSTVDPSAITNIIGVGKDAGDATLQFMFNNGSGTATKVNTGITPTVNDEYIITVELASNTASSTITIERRTKTASTKNSATNSAKIPSAGTLMYWHLVSNSAAVSTAPAVGCKQVFEQIYGY
jgi:hypothetical protein